MLGNIYTCLQTGSFAYVAPPKPSLMEIASVGIPERAETSPLERFVCINSSHDFTAAR